MLNIFDVRSANKVISFWACRIDNSDVDNIPPVMYDNRYSSSSCLVRMMPHTVFSITLTNQIMMNVLLILNVVWKAANLNDTATAGSVTFITWVTNHDTASVNG